MNFQIDHVIQIKKSSQHWTLSATQWVPTPRSQVFPFFANAKNLEKLTPDFLKFKIRRVSDNNIQVNTLIDYWINLHGLPIPWRTKIDEWQPLSHFVDVQIRGPFRLWHHRHEFEEMKRGTLLSDIVTFDLYCKKYQNTRLLRWVNKDLHKIFHYRHTQISKIFSEQTMPE